MTRKPSLHVPRGAAVAALVAALGAGLAACGGSKAGASDQQPAGTQAIAAAPAPAAAGQGQSGQQVFQRCAVCHQANGLGLPGSFPPLAGSEWATAANPTAAIRIVLHGLAGPITVKGAKFANMMPAYGTGQPLTDAQVAAVLTYVRSSWGNGDSAVTVEQVAAERSATASRTATWTANDLAPLLNKPGN